MSRSIGWRSRRVGLAAAAIFAAAGGVGYATIPDGGGVIHACYKNENGRLRVVDPSLPPGSADANGNVQQSGSNDDSTLVGCTKDETALTWNQTGPAGPPGPQGPPGPGPQPAARVVDCAAGQTVTQALAETATASFVDITVKGTCTESVNVGRDNVFLHAFQRGDGLSGPSADRPVLAVNGRQVRLQGLTLTGGSQTVDAVNGQFVANGLDVSGGQVGLAVGGGGNAFVSASTIAGSNEGVHAGGGGSLQVQGSTIKGNGASGGDGVVAQSGGSIDLRSTTVSGARHGVIAYPGGSAALEGSTVEKSTGSGLFAFGGSVRAFGGSVTGGTYSGASAYPGGFIGLASGVRIADNSVGVSTDGGRVLIQDGVVIENNRADGLQVSRASSATVEGGTATIRNNGGDGVHISDNSVASFNPTTQITGNHGWGVFCDSAPSNPLIIGQNPTGVTGNTSGNIRCQHG